MENSITHSNMENFISKKALNLLGMYLSTQGKAILEKKDLLAIKAIQEIFWKALRPTFNRIYIHTSKGGERLRTKMQQWLFHWLLSLGNFDIFFLPPNNNQRIDESSAIKEIIKHSNPENVQRLVSCQVTAPQTPQTPSSELSSVETESLKALRLRSAMLTRIGKLNTLRVLLDQIETYIPVNSAYEYNRQKNKSNGIYRLFCRQSKRTIDRLSKLLQKNKKFGARTNFLVRSEACVICSLDECMDEDDLFVYCDSCSILIHRKCLGIAARDLEKQPWFCTNCLRHRHRKLQVKALLEHFQANEAIDAVCGRRKKNGTRKRVSQVICDIFELSEGPCVFCGKEDGITLPIQGLPDYYGHVSCAKWNNSVRVSDEFDSIYFVTEDELERRLNPFNEKLELSRSEQRFFSSKLYPVNRYLESLFASDNFEEELKLLKGFVRDAFKSSSPALNRDKTVTLSPRLKKNKILFQKKSICKCLYHSVISINFLFIFRRQLCKLIFPLHDPSILGKISKTIVELYPFIKGNYHRPRCPKGACADCHFPPPHKCQICLTSQGLIFKCSENKCKRLFHVECARRVFCEMVPKWILAKDFMIFCPEHSKGSVFRREDSSKRRLQRKNLEICNLLNSHHQKVLTAKKCLEKDGDFKFFEEYVEKDFYMKKHLIDKPEQLITKNCKINGVKLNGSKKGKTKRVRKNKFLKMLQDREIMLKDKLRKGVLNSESYWFLKFKKIRPAKKKILWNLKKEDLQNFKIKNIVLFN